ncbi:MAG: hypothetical protein GC164_15550 [Phycisphaera sp.]|nr:hypothetical protein [Phycisphaera sp.]
MPLTLNVGLSRKASRDFQSTGLSINITAELDQSLLSRPDELQAQIDALYEQAEQALSRQAEKSSNTPAPSTQRQTDYTERGDRSDRRYSRPDTTRRPSSNGRNGHDRSTAMTRSQRRAIESIARRLGLEPEAEVDQEFGWVFNDLTLREASKVIDHLKGLQSHEERVSGAPDNGGSGGSSDPSGQPQGSNGRAR